MSLADPQWCPSSVQVTVQQARGLRAKGKSGTNDAYALMQVGKEKFQTSVVEKSVAPVWREEAAFDLPPPLHQDGGGGGGKERGTLHVHVLHRALVGPDKLLGQAVINLLQLGEDKTRDKAEWFKLLDKTGKADKDRGEVLLDIQFMRNNMTGSMFDLSATGKSRSRLGKLKDKVRGKKKESDTTSNVVPSFNQVLTESDEEGDGEVVAGKGDKKKKHKVKSLFSHKSNLQKNMSQSMSVLTAKNFSLSSSQSSGLNVDPSEGKKKFKFLIHKRSNSSDNKDASSGHEKHGAAEQSNVCINGSHVYCEEPPPRASRIGSNFSLASSGHGSMEDVPENSPSVDSLRVVRQYSPWTEEEEEEEELENKKEDVGQLRREEEEKIRMEEEMRRKEEERVRREEELERLADEERRQEEEERRTEEENVKREEEANIRREEERRRQEEEERVKREQEERIKREQEECKRLADKKWRLQEQERLIEEERVRKEEEERVHEERVRKEEEERVHEERRRKEEEILRMQEEEREEKRKFEKQERSREEERIRMEEESAQEERRQEEEERVRRQEEELEKKRFEEQERSRKEEEERIRMEESAQEERRQEERVRRQEEECEEKRFEEQERSRKEEEERIRMEEESAQEERRQEERVRRQEEECEEKRFEEQERSRKEEEERIRMEEESAQEERRQEEEERVRRQEEELEKKRFEEQERSRKEEEERIRMEEESAQGERRRQEEEEREEKRRFEKQERSRKEEEERIRMAEESAQEERRRQEERVRGQEEERKLAEEKRRLEEEERRRREHEERIKKEEKARREKEEYERLMEEKRKLEEEEEEERKRIKAEEKIRREEEKRIRVEEERRQEEERVRKQKKEEREQLAEEKRIQERRIEKERKQREEEERVRKEKEINERLVVEKLRQQEQKRRIEEEEKIRRERKEEEVRKLETEKLTREAGQQKRDNKTKPKAAGTKPTVAVESSAEVTSTNPFDENFSNNPFEEIPDSPAGPDSATATMSTVQQRVQFAALSGGSKPVSSDEKDSINTQRERRPAPQPPGRNQAERPSRREQDGATQPLAQINKKSKDKDIKTVSVLPQRSVQMIAPLSRSPTEKKNTQSLTQSCATKETSNVVKHSKRTAPLRPGSVEEGLSSEQKTALSSDDVSHECGSEVKQVSIVHGLNPFEDDAVENAAQDDSTTSGGHFTEPVLPVLSQAADKDAATQTKIKSSKAHAPPLPAKTDAMSSTSINQNTERGRVADGTGVTVNSATHSCDPASEAISPVRVQETPLQESQPASVQSAGEDAGGIKVGPPKASRRLQPVKPLHPLEQQFVSVDQGVKDNKSTGILGEVQVKTKVKDTGLKGPYSQLTQGELISLVRKQEKQLSERDKKISELEQYIDNLLVRIIEEKPSILMSLNSLNKAT